MKVPPQHEWAIVPTWLLVFLGTLWLFQRGVVHSDPVVIGYGILCVCCTLYDLHRYIHRNDEDTSGPRPGG